jgi:predicted DNA-binding transcriptional regulator YafY
MQNNLGSGATLQRQWHLLGLLPSRAPGITTNELLQQLNEAGFALKKRQVERDLQMLSTMFPLQCNDKSKPFGWYWAVPTQLPAMTLSDAMSWQLMAPMLEKLLPAPLYQVIQPKLLAATQLLQKSESGNQTARLSQKLAYVPAGVMYQAATIDQDVLQCLQQAVWEERCVNVLYHQTYKDRHIQLLLHPLALVHTSVQLYLVAVADGHKDVRLYALHRCKQATLTDQLVQIPPDFELQSYLNTGAMQFRTGAIIDFQARISKKLAAILRETPLSADMTLQTGQDHDLLNAQIRDSWQFQLWLLSQGRDLEVLAPAALRQQIQQELTETLAYYQPAKPD